MNALIVGSGGREHALAWALRKSPRLERLYAAPGSAGMSALAEPAACDPLDAEALAAAVEHATVREVEELRAAGIDRRIYVFSPLLPGDFAATRAARAITCGPGRRRSACPNAHASVGGACI